MSKSDRRVTDLFRRRRTETDRPSEERDRWWRRRTEVAQGSDRALEQVGPAAFNKPVAGTGSRRGRRQVDALREQRDRGNRIRDWLQQRLVAAQKREKERRKAAGKLKVSRGVDRVPEHAREVERPQAWLVRHDLAQHPLTGRWVLGLPYRNPERAERLARSGRLRADEQVGPARGATPIATGRRTRKAGPHPWRDRLVASRSGRPATPNADARRQATDDRRAGNR